MAEREFGLLVAFSKYLRKELCVFVVASLYMYLAFELRGFTEGKIESKTTALCLI